MRLPLPQRTANPAASLRARTITLGLGLAASLWAAGQAQAQAPASATAAATAPAKESPEIRLSGERVTLPFVMVREFPFVEGRIAGASGKLMLDTGAMEALSVNTLRVPVKNVVEQGKAMLGSGQTYVRGTAPVVEDIHFAHLHFPKATHVSASQARHMEQRVTPDFLGWIGHELWDGYALEMDYQALRATFHRDTDQAYLVGQEVLAALAFEVRNRPNIPVMTARLGDMEMTAVFDTGQYGYLNIDEQTRDELVRKGVLVPSAVSGEYAVTGLTLSGVALPDIPAIRVLTEPFPPSASIGVPARKVLSLGYTFLRQYKTVWDDRRKTLYLLKKTQ